VTTVPHPHLISNYNKYATSFPCPVRLVSANEKNPQCPVGEGTVRIPTTSSPGYVDLRGFYTPGIPSIVISPRSVQEMFGFNNCSGYTLETRLDQQSFVFHALDSSGARNDIMIPGNIVGSLNYTHPILLPSFETPGTPADKPLHQIVHSHDLIRDWT
jgi:hypothetical protein